MLYLILIILVGWLFLVFKASKKVVARAIIESGNGEVQCKVDSSDNDVKPLYAMALCYAVKVKWLMLSEQQFVSETFNNVFEKTIKSWPVIPNVEMLSSLGKKAVFFKIDVYNIKGSWSCNNTLPNQLYAGDLATNYFFLLKAIVEKMNAEEKNILGKLLLNFQDDILNISDNSVLALRKYDKKISDLLSKI